MDQSSSNSTNTTSQIDYTTPTARFSLKSDDTFKDGLRCLDENGYVVISDVMNQDDIDENKGLLWKFLEDVSNGIIQRDQPETWSNQW
jgi:hypothetical protein